MEQGDIWKYPGGKEKIRRENGGVTTTNHPLGAIPTSTTGGIPASVGNLRERHLRGDPYPTEIEGPMASGRR